jgi:hypothetical protein
MAHVSHGTEVLLYTVADCMLTNGSGALYSSAVGCEQMDPLEGVMKMKMSNHEASFEVQQFFLFFGLRASEGDQNFLNFFVGFFLW